VASLGNEPVSFLQPEEPVSMGDAQCFVGQ